MAYLPKQKTQTGEREGGEERVPTKRITVDIPLATYEEIKQRNFKYAYLIASGLRAEKGQPQLLERINTLETQVSRLRTHLTYQDHKVSDFGARLTLVEKKD